MFCGFVVIIVFGMAFLGKARDRQALEQTVQAFSLLPLRWNRAAAWSLMIGEAMVVVLMLLVLLGGLFQNFAFLGALRMVGFGAGSALLVIYTGAILSALARHAPITCNCLGASQRRISSWDLVRNAGFVLCGVGGALLAADNRAYAQLHLQEWMLMALLAAIVVVVLINLSDLAELVGLRLDRSI